MNESRRQAAVAWIDSNLKPVLPENALQNSELLSDCLNQLISEETGERPLVCSSLIKLLDAQYTNPKTVFSFIETGLLHVHGLESESREHLIQSLLELPLHRANIGLDLDNQVTRQDAGKLALEALESSLNTLEDSNQLMAKVKLIELTGYRPALPNIQAIVDKTANQELKQAASETLFVLKNSVRQCWEDTPADHTSTLEQRNDHIKEAMQDETLLEREVIQALYNATKDSDIKNDDDPRIKLLEKLLQHQSEIVRLAASYSVIQICRSSNYLFKDAIQNIADIGVNGANKGCCIEAGIILEEIALKSPEQGGLINQSREKANLEFLKRFKL